MTGCTVRRYEQLETSPETIEQELRPAVCERRLTDRLKENYSIDDGECDTDYSWSTVVASPMSVTGLEFRGYVILK